MQCHERIQFVAGDIFLGLETWREIVGHYSPFFPLIWRVSDLVRMNNGNEQPMFSSKVERQILLQDPYRCRGFYLALDSDFWFF
jgi:hypothetical protein